MIENEIECPHCGALFEIDQCQNDKCPKCGKKYWWDEISDDDEEDDYWPMLEWEYEDE